MACDRINGWWLRWMIRRDMDEVRNIEDESFDDPWTERNFIECLRERNCIGIVAVDDDEFVRGYMIYELHKTRLHVLNFAVDPRWRRRGVGRAMVAKLVGKLSAQRRTRIDLEVRETNVEGQLFFRALGFRAVSVLRDHYDDHPGLDAYVMHYRYGDRSADATKWRIEDRAAWAKKTFDQNCEGR